MVTNLINEVWKPIPDYENYEVSNMGRVKKGERLLKQNVRKYDGYAQIHIAADDKHYTKKVHRLVAFAFPDVCGDYFDGAEVNHKNAIRTDNRAENLEWIDHKTNCNYGDRVEKFSMKIAQVDSNGETVKVWNSLRELERCGFGRHIVRRCVDGNCQYKGYYWRQVAA